MTLRLAVPGIFLAGLLLLPFLNKPYTIDDPLFLREAAHGSPSSIVCTVC